MKAKLALVTNKQPLSQVEVIHLEKQAIARLKQFQEPPPLRKPLVRFGNLIAAFLRAVFKPVELDREVAPGMPAQKRHEWEKNILRPLF